MVKNFILTGDCHGVIAVKHRIQDIYLNTSYNPEEIAVIILGDASLNFWLSSRERHEKEKLGKFGTYIYCVRGNHEERPEYLGYKLEYDENVKGEVYIDTDNNLIRYFKDGGEYEIKGHSVLTIGGAYSVDKDYRIAAAGGVENSGWFPGEQLSESERAEVATAANNKSYDFVFTHTCPISWEPRDLFLGGIDQSKVDKTTELWLDEMRESLDWKIWCFGHFHADRLERPHVEQYYRTYAEIDDIWNRWYGEETFKQDPWWPKSPMFFAEGEQ